MPFLTIPEPMAMLARNPFITDFSSDGPIPYVMRQKLTKAPVLPPAERIKDRTVLITGATGGVGLSAAQQFLQLGAVLLLGVRDTIRGNVVRDLLLQEVPSGSVTTFELDLASFDSVDRFVKTVKASLSGRGLDIAIMNAASLSRERNLTVDGHEMLLQVNLLSTAYLSSLLTPLLSQKSIPGRLVVVTSEAHAWVTYSPSEDGQIINHLDQDTTNFADRYNLTKLLITLWTEALAKSIDRSQLEVTMTTPGFCASDLFRDSKGLMLQFINLTSARPLSYGGKTHIHAASAPLSTNGQYFRDGKQARWALLPFSYTMKLTRIRTSRFCHSDAGDDLRTRLYREVNSLLKARNPDLELETL